jgi:hypothetical protein
MCGADIPDPTDPVEPVDELKKKAKLDRKKSIEDQATDWALIK